MRRRLAALTAVPLLLLVGCSSDDGSPAGGTDRGVEDTDDLEQTEPPASVDAGSEEEPFQCTPLSVDPAGVYTVGDAGTVELLAVDGVLDLGEVIPTDGWTHEVTEEDDDDVEVTFTGDDGGEIALVASLQADDADPTLEICGRVE
ncbi:hypothetical protein [Cellulomonas carbonis]|uniref:Lipoprotein n=1 Tax=Cellulomonas carbonis T26 TaxID=947969 RepID=A0A0A0BMN7_9CELL|nr:hypothetical protein [Cellulomonas carbonis]KGM09733.1 hypothetical protein N868_09480 [Cellulomonas carbonis T26]GGC00001.1 hypothetical protein GCM10010972_10970 [Cellulomonas carbonis]